MTRPSKLPRWADNVSGGLPGRVEPNEAKKDDGYGNAVQPTAGEHNHLFGHLGDWIQYIDGALDAVRRHFGEGINNPFTAQNNAALLRVVPVPAAGAKPILLATSASTLVYSYDGIEWFSIANAPSAGINDIDVDTTVSPNRVMLALASGGAVEYTDDVRDGTWTSKSMPAGNASRIIWSDDAGAGLVSNGSGNAIYRFTDITAGSPFTAATTPPTGVNPDGFAYSPSLDRWLLIDSTDLGTDQPFAYSDDDGDTWTLCNTISGTLDPDGGNHNSLVWLTAGGSNGAGSFYALVEEGTTNPNPRLYESSDGITWTDVSSRIDYFYEQGQWCDSVGGLIALGPREAIGCVRPTDDSGRGAVLTTDGGQTWSPIYLPRLEEGTTGAADSAAVFDGRIIINGKANDNRHIWRSATV